MTGVPAGASAQQPSHVRVAQPDAAVRRRQADRAGLVRPVERDRAVLHPVAEDVRVGRDPERGDSEHAVRVGEQPALVDEVAPGRRRRLRRADRDARAQHGAPVPVGDEPPPGEVDDDVAPNLEDPHGAGRDPAGLQVGRHRNLDEVGGRRAPAARPPRPEDAEDRRVPVLVAARDAREHASAGGSAEDARVGADERGERAARRRLDRALDAARGLHDGVPGELERRRAVRPGRTRLGAELSRRAAAAREESHAERESDDRRPHRAHGGIVARIRRKPQRPGSRRPATIPRDRGG